MKEGDTGGNRDGWVGGSVGWLIGWLVGWVGGGLLCLKRPQDVLVVPTLIVAKNQHEDDGSVYRTI